MSSFTSPLKYKALEGQYRNGRQLYEITEEFIYRIGSLQNPLGEVKVPAGFITDLASVPWPISIFLKPEGDWSRAAIIHDYLITEANRGEYQSFEIIDAIFKEALLVSGVNKHIAHLFFLSVRIAAHFRNK